MSPRRENIPPVNENTDEPEFQAKPNSKKRTIVTLSTVAVAALVAGGITIASVSAQASEYSKQYDSYTATVTDLSNAQQTYLDVSFKHAGAYETLTTTATTAADLKTHLAALSGYTAAFNEPERAAGTTAAEDLGKAIAANPVPAKPATTAEPLADTTTAAATAKAPANAAPIKPAAKEAAKPKIAELSKQASDDLASEKTNVKTAEDTLKTLTDPTESLTAAILATAPALQSMGAFASGNGQPVLDVTQSAPQETRAALAAATESVKNAELIKDTKANPTIDNVIKLREALSAYADSVNQSYEAQRVADEAAAQNAETYTDPATGQQVPNQGYNPGSPSYTPGYTPNYGGGTGDPGTGGGAPSGGGGTTPTTPAIPTTPGGGGCPAPPPGWYPTGGTANGCPTYTQPGGDDTEGW